MAESEITKQQYVDHFLVEDHNWHIFASESGTNDNGKHERKLLYVEIGGTRFKVERNGKEIYTGTNLDYAIDCYNYAFRRLENPSAYMNTYNGG